MPAPACSMPMSSSHSSILRNGCGTSPAAIRRASPSTTAVLPTPASPVSSGLFCLRRIRISTIWRISSSRPTTGSILPSCARSVRFCPYWASVPCAVGVAPVLAASTAACWLSLLAASSVSKLSLKASTLILLNCGEMPFRTLARFQVFSSPINKWPPRMRLTPYFSEP